MLVVALQGVEVPFDVAEGRPSRRVARVEAWHVRSVTSRMIPAAPSPPTAALKQSSPGVTAWDGTAAVHHGEAATCSLMNPSRGRYVDVGGEDSAMLCASCRQRGERRPRSSRAATRSRTRMRRALGPGRWAAPSRSPRVAVERHQRIVGHHPAVEECAEPKTRSPARRARDAPSSSLAGCAHLAGRVAKRRARCGRSRVGPAPRARESARVSAFSTMLSVVRRAQRIGLHALRRSILDS